MPIRLPQPLFLIERFAERREHLAVAKFRLELESIDHESAASKDSCFENQDYGDTGSCSNHGSGEAAIFFETAETMRTFAIHWTSCINCLAFYIKTFCLKINKIRNESVFNITLSEP